MPNRLILLGGLLLFFYAGLGLLLYTQQRDLIYFPTPASDIEGFERREIAVDGGDSASVWTRHRGKPQALIYFGGNAEALQPIAALLASLFPEHALYLALYPGYGGAAGAPTQEDIYRNALAVHDAVAQRHRRVAVIGRSLGSGVAAYLAARRPLEKLVMVTPFDSMTSLAQETIPLYPMRILLHDHYDSLSLVPEIEEPTLLLVAGNDEIISRAHSDRLRTAFSKDQVDEVVVDKSGHNNIILKQEFAMALLLFVGDIPQEQ